MAILETNILSGLSKVIYLTGLFMTTNFQSNLTENDILTCQLPEYQNVCHNLDFREAVKEVVLSEMVVWTHPETGEVSYTGSCANQNGGCEAHVNRIVNVIFDLSCESGFDPIMILAMAKHESNYNPFVVHDRTRATGLLQLMPRSFFAKGVDFVHSPSYRNECRDEEDYCQEEIIHASFRLLYRSIYRCGNIEQGIGMYGSGSCNGSRSFVRYVGNHSDRIRREATVIYEREMAYRNYENKETN